jgi:hypothetical protein
MAWNPNANQAPWDIARLREQATQPNFPGSGVGANQGALYDESIQAYLDRPQDMSINVTGWKNPYSLTLYNFAVGLAAVRPVPPNLRRAYLLIQNQGPGNLWLNFGQDVTVASLTAPSNGIQLIQTQILEQIGGGDVDEYQNPRANAFVSPDYVSMISDDATTTVLVGEGIWRFVANLSVR